MAVRRLGGLLIGIVLNLIIITFGSFLFLNLFLLITALSIRWREITPSGLALH
jgi:hypothetical protein